MTVALSPKIKM
jgi:hypothetical protein